jgi:uncharacterized membrane protein YraQ (UPF0718 family)
LLINLVFADSPYYWFLDRFSSSYTRKILVEAIQLLGDLWPYLVSGIILTTLIKFFFSRQQLASLFPKKQGFISIFIASLLGIISPLGSYVIIPLSAALYGVGIPLAPLMALMISSPLINPNLFLLTAGAFGIEMAILRTLSALILGVSAGYLTIWIMKKNIIKTGNILRTNSTFSLNDDSADRNRKPFSRFLIELYRMTIYISKFFFLAILLAAVIKIFINPNWMMRFFGDNNFLAVLITSGAGVPFYVCGGAAIPVVQQLAELGMSKGAVLAFFISGPVTRISNLIIVNFTFKSTILWLYLLTGIGGAFLFGLLYNLVR